MLSVIIHHSFRLIKVLIDYRPDRAYGGAFSIPEPVVIREK